ncbi:MAG: cytochrome c [Candidatus Obscuribacterales bacterium]|nr:cytochrome c [Candidatus Obscuribacterales bacterium]
MQKLLKSIYRSGGLILYGGIAFGVALLSADFNACLAAPDGAGIFQKKCAMCHADGGNRMDPKKPVKGSKHIKTKDAFKQYLLKKNGVMPAFPQIAENDPALTALHDYVKGLK